MNDPHTERRITVDRPDGMVEVFGPEVTTWDVSPNGALALWDPAGHVAAMFAAEAWLSVREESQEDTAARVEATRAAMGGATTMQVPTVVLRGNDAAMLAALKAYQAALDGAGTTSAAKRARVQEAIDNLGSWIRGSDVAATAPEAP